MEDASSEGESSRPQLHLSGLPPFIPVTLPKHLRHPSLPPPTGPLPRPPSITENEEIGARLSANSPLMTGSMRSKLTAFPFPTIPEMGTAPAQPETLSQLTTQTPKSPSSSQLSPSNFLVSSDSPASLARQPSAHTQASSDALGETPGPSTLYGPAALTSSTQGHRQSAISTSSDRSDYSGLSLTESHPDDSDDLMPATAPMGLSISNSTPLLHSQSLSFLRGDRRDSNLSLNSTTNGPNPGRGSRRESYVSGISIEDIQADSRRLSRISGLSYMSGGAAIVVSEEDTNLGRNSSISYKVHKVLPELTGVTPLKRDESSSGGEGPSEVQPISPISPISPGRLGSFKDPIRVHPADHRFEHTYRVRRASEAEEPIFVPVYTFEPPGKFPDRSRITAPKTVPRFVNHTPRNFSLPGRSTSKSTPRSSSDSAEMLLGGSGTFDGTDPYDIQAPETAYGAHMKTRRSSGPMLPVPRSPQALMPTSPTSHSSRVGQLPKIMQPLGAEKYFKKETASQRFEREHSHYFHDLDRVERAEGIASPNEPIHRPRYSFTARYGVPSMNRPPDAYIGDDINPGRWPDRYKRQKRIGRSLLCVCVLMPPMWLIMAVGLLDNLVLEMTDGDIWGVGQSEKVAAAWLGGIFCFSLVVAIITVGVVVL
ncbi:hypothetical protein DRE_05124 [Drechslerella stenobrocha 248]|uniref:Uncharacterized protein n=1 Tax=Drechslerella stenobrocha 248 TaxID=1043628 RepID=W7HZY4_9PEZI|nr:hypothetical protein DRE_05124 [Drechslerella stenobrocha 248]